MSGFWDQKEPTTSEWELTAESVDTIDDQAQSILDEYEDEEQHNEETEEYMEDYKSTGESAYKLDKRESNVLNDATIRLEQARLYDMLIKHDLFQGVQANPQALNNVQNELKAYIVSRLEILLGIRQEIQETEEDDRQFIVDSPFNDIEIEFLKALSYKGTKGASAQGSAKQLSASEIRPLSDPNISVGLRSLSQTPINSRPAPIQKVSKPTIIEKPIKKLSTNVTQQIKKEPSKSIVRSRRGQMSNAEAEEIARKELAMGSGKLNKHPYEMTPKELKELAKRSSIPNKKVPVGALPPATSAQSEMLIQQQQLRQQSLPGAGGVNLLVQKLIHDKNR